MPAGAEHVSRRRMDLDLTAKRLYCAGSSADLEHVAKGCAPSDKPFRAGALLRREAQPVKSGVERHFDILQQAFSASKSVGWPIRLKRCSLGFGR